MKELVFEPKPIKDNDGKNLLPAFTGKVKVKALKYADRLDLIADGNLDAPLSNDKSIEFKRIKQLIDIATRHVTSVDLVRTSDESKVTSVEDLEYDNVGGNLLAEIGAFVLHGGQTGNV
jgi:hypothetical protein